MRCGACGGPRGEALASGPPLCARCRGRVAALLARGGGAFYTCSSIERRAVVIAAEPAPLRLALGACVRALRRGGEDGGGGGAAGEGGSGGRAARGRAARDALAALRGAPVVVWAGAGVSAAAGIVCGAMPPPRLRTPGDYARAVPAPAALPREAEVHGSLRAIAACAGRVRGGGSAFLVTSNVDGALVGGWGDPGALLEVHGSVRRTQCAALAACGDGALRDVAAAAPGEGAAACRSCGGPLRVAVSTAGDEDDDLALGLFEAQAASFGRFLEAARARGGALVHLVCGVGPDNADSLIDEVRLVQQHRLAGLVQPVIWLNVEPPPADLHALELCGDMSATLPALAAQWDAAWSEPQSSIGSGRFNCCA